MSRIRLSHPSQKLTGRIAISGSKSESNRALVLKHLFLPGLEIRNLSDSQDTQVMQAALEKGTGTINIGDAGTAMRFLTAFFSVKQHAEVVLSGSPRMHERPIGVLVDALRAMGADIRYKGEPGFPPLVIKGKTLERESIAVSGGISSQFISALMLVAPRLSKGLTIYIKGFSVSAPYIYLTASIMNRLGFYVRIKGEEVYIEPFVPGTPGELVVEPDWSSASYWYSMALLAREAELFLPYFREVSMQGDAAVRGIFDSLGVLTIGLGNGFRLKKGKRQKQDVLRVDLLHTPDIAQTLAVALAAIGQRAELTGLQTLRIKETDRLVALKKELEKCGAHISITDNSLCIEKGIAPLDTPVFDTWGDHRMAMALAPLALLGPIEINHPEVVKKSYPAFWNDLERVGFEIVSG